MTDTTKTIIQIVVIIGVLISVFMFGRSTVTITTNTEYIKGDTIYGDTVKIPIPVEFIPDSIQDILDKLPLKADTVYVDSLVTVIQSVDSAAIIADYIKLRRYEDINLFDSDTLGKLDITADVQFNELQSIDYSFIPITKVESSVMETKKFMPYVMGGISNQFYPSIGAGTTINNFMVGYELGYDHANESKIHSIKFGYMFR